jgi:hypothetical protein
MIKEVSHCKPRLQLFNLTLIILDIILEIGIDFDLSSQYGPLLLFRGDFFLQQFAPYHHILALSRHL